MKNNEIALFFTHLTNAQADLLLIFLKTPKKMHLGEIEELATAANIPQISYYALTSNLTTLIAQKFLISEKEKTGKLNYQVEKEFFSSWRSERLRLKLELIKISEATKESVSSEQLYDESTRKYFLL